EIFPQSAVVLKPQLLDHRNRVLLEGVVDCLVETNSEQRQGDGGFSGNGAHDECGCEARRLPAPVSRCFWRRLLGLSGMGIFSISAACRSGWRPSWCSLHLQSDLAVFHQFLLKLIQVDRINSKGLHYSQSVIN